MNKLLLVLALCASVSSFASYDCNSNNTDDRFLSQDENVHIQDLDLLLSRIDNERYDGFLWAKNYSYAPSEAINLHIDPAAISFEADTGGIGRGGALEIKLLHKDRNSDEVSEYLLGRLIVLGKGYFWQDKSERLNVPKVKLRELADRLNQKVQDAKDSGQAVMFSSFYLPSRSCATGIESYMDIIRAVPLKGDL